MQLRRCISGAWHGRLENATSMLPRGRRACSIRDVPELPPEILQAIETAVEEHGFATATLEDMATAMGLNRVTLYRRGYRREQLLADVAAAAVEEFKEASLPALTGKDNAATRLRLLLDALCDLADRHLALVAALYDGPTVAFHLSLDDHELLTRFEYTEPFERIIVDGVEDGTLQSDDPAEDAELVFNLVGWTYVHLRRSHGWPVERARAALFRQLRIFT